MSDQTDFALEAEWDFASRPSFELACTKNDYWRTPRELKNRIQKVATHPLYDPCPARPQRDGLTASWGRSVFLNPPYSTGQLEIWSEKAWEEFSKGATEEVFWLINFGATVNRGLIKRAACALIDPYRRISFIDPRTGRKKSGNDRDSILYIWSHYYYPEGCLESAFEGFGEVFVTPPSRS